MLKTGGVLTKEEVRLINPVTLAFVGDAVYSLYVRERLVLAGGGKASYFQRAASKVVSAHGQSDFLEKFFPNLPRRKRRFSAAAGTRKRRRRAKTPRLRSIIVPRASKRYSAFCICRGTWRGWNSFSAWTIKTHIKSTP